MIRNLFGGSKCRTVDVCDIFGDNSGKALYRLDGNANDESGNYHGTETAMTYGGGVYERGAVFNGTSSVITTTYPQPTAAFTLAAWFKSTAFDAYSILSSSNSAATAFCNIDINSGKIRFMLTGVNSAFLFSVNRVDDGVWHHVALTWDGTTSTNSIKVYIDGSLSSQMTATGATPTASGTPFSIGKHGAYPAYYNGLIDQVRILNRAITATEVATLYAECAPTSTVDNINPFENGSLKALYQFNGDATDKTGVYNGTATNVTYGTGKFGQGIIPAVSTGKVDIGYPLSSLNNDLSISLWVKMSSIPSLSAAGSYLFNAYGGNFRIVIDSTQKIAFGIYDGTDRLISSTTTPVINTWYFITIVRSKTTGMKLYVDGKLEASNTITVDPTVFGSEIGFGTYTGRLGIAGVIDQARIFNKALTPMEVASLYNETTPLEEPMHSLVDPFKDGSGKALYRLDGNALDESGNYNGTATSVTYGNAPIGREAIFGGASSITATLALSANTFSYSVWATVTTVSSTIQSLIDFSTGRAMLSSGNGTNAYVSYYDGTAYRVFGTYALTSATRTHIGLAVNGTSVELFINGVSQGTSACSAVTPSGTMALGKYAGSAAGYLTGREDQARIFTRVLTASEFLQLYNQGA